jgi:hypothetical protein
LLDAKFNVYSDTGSLPRSYNDDDDVDYIPKTVARLGRDREFF